MQKQQSINLFCVNHYFKLFFFVFWKTLEVWFSQIQRKIDCCNKKKKLKFLNNLRCKNLKQIFVAIILFCFNLYSSVQTPFACLLTTLFSSSCTLQFLYFAFSYRFTYSNFSREFERKTSAALKLWWPILIWKTKNHKNRLKLGECSKKK